MLSSIVREWVHIMSFNRHRVKITHANLPTCHRVTSIKSQVLGAGVEPAYLSAPEPKSGVSAIPPPERPVTQTFYCSRPSGKRFAI